MSQNKANQITLRGLPGPLLKEIRQEARRLGVSISQAVVNRLLPQKQQNKTHDGFCADLLSLAGTWDDETASHFDQSLKEQRQIDEKLWRS